MLTQEEQGTQMAMRHEAHCVLAGKVGLLLETESEALFYLKSHKPDAKKKKRKKNTYCTRSRKVEENQISLKQILLSNTLGVETITERLLNFTDNYRRWLTLPIIAGSI